MTKQQILDLYYLDARGKLVEIAAFLDRVQRAQGEADFRLPALKKAIRELEEIEANRAERVLMSLSDRSQEPIDKAPSKGAVGAPIPFSE